MTADGHVTRVMDGPDPHPPLIAPVGTRFRFDRMIKHVIFPEGNDLLPRGTFLDGPLAGQPVWLTGISQDVFRGDDVIREFKPEMVEAVYGQ